MNNNIYPHDHADHNGHDNLLAEFESPFTTTVNEEVRLPQNEFSYQVERESPFLTNVITSEHETPSGPEAQLFVQFLDEVNDDEFAEAITDLANEAERYTHEHISGSMADHEVIDANRHEELLMSHLQPLTVATDRYLDQLAHEFNKHDAAQISDEEVDSIMERFAPDHELGNPVFDHFFKRFRKKFKRIVNRVRKVVKKGISIVKKFSPLAMVMKKIKKMAHSLFGKIVRKVILKLPWPLHKPASMLARRFGFKIDAEMTNLEIAELELFDDEFEDEFALPSAGPDYEMIQREFDLRLAEQFFAETDEEAQRSLDAYVDNQADLKDGAKVARLDKARAQLVKTIQTAGTPAEVEPYVEEFVGIALTILRKGIRFIGRDKVIKFVAKIFTKLIARLIGPKQAAPLAHALVDKGFRMLNLEVTEQEADNAASEAIVQILEELTISLSGMRHEVVENQELLEQEVYEQFTQLVATNFPSNMVQEEFQESEIAATWALLPVRGKKRYKKYSKIIDLTLTRDKVRGLKTFGGQYLQSFLRRKHGHQRGGSLRVKVHIFQAVRGTTLSHISLLERNTPGLGSARRSAWSQIHPLTPRVAGQLLGNAALGKRVSNRWLNKRGRIQIAQRFYYLEVLGAAPSGGNSPGGGSSGGSLPTKPGVVKDEAMVKLDFTRSTMTLALMMTEPKAAEVARRLRANDYFGAATTFRTSIRDALNNILLKHAGRQVKVVMELSEDLYLEEHFTALLRRGGKKFGNWAKQQLQKIVKKLLVKLVSQTEKALASSLPRLRADFFRAQENTAQGVTIHLVFVDMPGMAILRTAFKIAKGKPMSVGDVLGTVLPSLPTPDMHIFPGRKSL